MPTTTLMTRSYKMSTASTSLSLTAEFLEAGERPADARSGHPARQRLRHNDGCHTAVFLRDHLSHDPQCFWGGRFVEGQAGLKRNVYRRRWILGARPPQRSRAKPPRRPGVHLERSCGLRDEEQVRRLP